ncbi:MAG: cupin domain-containing protein [Thermoplasmata archaeon]|jgi:oxalate decarboxylase/phosphoglucose isomerase-like protein (cupin superfamily)|nr:cupin domain-containing protein [Thermoplasmata archaeon]
MDAIETLVERARRSGRRYFEFLRVPSMSAGVYVLPAAGIDGQSPHREDEVYHVVRGRATFMHRGSDRPVGPGDVLFVPAHDPHRFHSIEEELVMLVVFAPAETPPPPTESRDGPGGRAREPEA